METAHHLLIQMREKVRRKPEFIHLKQNPDELKKIIDQTRKKNGKINYTGVGTIIGIDNETAKRWITDLGLINY